MQVMPETALRYGIANVAREPEANLKAGTRYLSDLLKLFDNRLDLALAAYNAGEKAVIRYRMRIPPYRETEQYVPAVLAKYHEWHETPPTPPGLRRIEYLPGTTLEPAAQRGSQP
jgi:soluble lytic murein transglycosylase-like protein